MKTFSFSGVMAVFPLLWRKSNTVTLGKVLNRGKETKGLTERETTVCFLKLIQEKLTLLNAVNTKNNTRGGSTYWKLLEKPGQEETSKLIGRLKKKFSKGNKSSSWLSHRNNGNRMRWRHQPEWDDIINQSKPDSTENCKKAEGTGVTSAKQLSNQTHWDWDQRSLANVSKNRSLA